MTYAPGMYRVVSLAPSDAYARRVAPGSLLEIVRTRPAGGYYATFTIIDGTQRTEEWILGGLTLEPVGATGPWVELNRAQRLAEGSRPFPRGDRYDDMAKWLLEHGRDEPEFEEVLRLVQALDSRVSQQDSQHARFFQALQKAS